ncbi:OmpA family protein [Methylococcus sp. EFPC2]|uniref:OmpA family protein n=1 Tax=Methylococcus sp. EFPC2 TaxID=2812648 RepID=UPI001967B08D|nr:OmpA family protein [Methylococcus sp. EFPC2]QSA97859.1 OmpA family protein [Methylococcus sp. EFPC2]
MAYPFEQIRRDLSNAKAADRSASWWGRIRKAMSLPGGARHDTASSGRVMFEALEPRMLLSADLAPDLASGGAQDVTLRFDQLANVYQLVDAQSQVLSSVAATAADDGLTIAGSASPDTLRLDLQSLQSLNISLLDDGPGADTLIASAWADESFNLSGTILAVGDKSFDLFGFENLSLLGGAGDNAFAVDGWNGAVDVDGGAGNDTLEGPAADSTWQISGEGSGTVGNVAFAGIENLAGAADNQDTFVFQAAGELSGYVDGGEGGYDLIELSDGIFANVSFVATGVDSGTIARDSDSLSYTGFEPIIDATGGAKTLFLPALPAGSSDRITLLDQGATDDGRFAVSVDTAEDIIFTAAASITSLTIQSLDGDDTIVVQALDTDFTAPVTIAAGAGDDDITLAELSPGVVYTVNAGAGDTDSLRFAGSGSLVLTDTALDTIVLDSVERAYLGGGSLNAAGFSGQVFFSANSPQWVEQGPRPYATGLATPLLWDPVAGAIQAIVVDPADRFTTYIGTTNGGVWRNSGGTEVLFDLNSATLDLADKNTLNAFANFLEQHPTLTVEIGGHTDSSGLAADNETLSLTRATNVRNYLVDIRHIDPSRLNVVAYGETRPIAKNDGSGHSAENRRVELQIQNWEPLTDEMQSLSIGSLAISPLDHETLYAGLARTSSFKKLGGPLDGLLFSADRGDHWQPLAANELQGLVVTKVLPTTMTTASGAQVVFVSTFDVDRDGDGVLDDRGGVFRLEVAADGTLEAFQKISGAGGMAGLQGGPYTDLAMDTSGALVRVYAANINQGLFRFTEGDASWVAINNNFQMGDTDANGQDDLLQGSTRIKFAIDAASGTLYTGVIGPVNANGIFDITGKRRGLVSLFKTTDHGDNWSAIAVPTSTDGAAPGVVTGLHPGRQGDTHFSMVVDPTNPNILYVAGDRQPTTTNNSLGLSDFAGRIFRFDPTLNAGAGGWEQLVGSNTSDALHITAPHADSRGLVFVGDYQLMQITDGGLYRLQNPRNEPAVGDDVSQGERRWTSQNRDLRSTEVLDLDFDTLNGTILIGAQDDGSTYQTGNADGLDNDNDGAVDEADERFFWTGDTAGDGNAQIALPFNSDGTPGDDRVLRYSLFNNFKFLDVYEFDANATQLDANPADATTQSFRIGLRSAAAGAARLSGIDPLDRNLGFDRIPMALNAIDRTRMVIGYNGIYESINVNLAPGPNRVLPLEQVSTIDPAVAGRPVRDLIYGGRIGNAANADLVIAARGSQVLVRQVVNTAFTSRTVTGAGNIQAIAVDPHNWKVVYATDGTNVFRIDDVTDNAKAWVRISGNLGQIGQKDQLSLEYVENAGGDLLLLGGSGGVTRLFNPDTASDATAHWSRVGSGLPSALVSDIEYVDRDGSGTITQNDVLVAGTMGRGAWSIGGSDILALAQPSKLQILGASTADSFTLSISASNPLRFEVVDDNAGGAVVYSARYDSFDSVEGLLRGGDDTFTINHGHGALAVPGGILVNGGEPGQNTLVLTGGDAPESASGAGFREIVDLSGKREHVDFVQVAAIDDNGLPDPLDNPFDTVRGAFESLFDLLTFDDGLGQDLPFFGTSFARALNNVSLNNDLPISTPGEAVPSQAEQVVEASTDTQDFLRRFFTTGPGAITLADLSSFTTLQQLADALDALDQSGTGSVSFSGDLLTGFELTLAGISKTMSGRADVDLDLLGGDISLAGKVDVSADVTLNLVFGVDNTNGFYVRSNAGHDIVIDNIHVGNLDSVEASGQFGFLGVDLTNAALAMAPGVHFDIDINNAGDSFVQVSDLLANLANYTAVNLVGDPAPNIRDVTLTGTFGVSAFLPGEAAPFSLLDARATVTWDDIEAPLLNGPGNVDVQATVGSAGGAALMRFLQLDATQFATQLTSLRDQLDDALGAKVPFLSDGLTTIVGFVNKFQTAVIDPITGGIGGSAAIPSVQELAKRIAANLGIEPQALGLDYNSSSTELTYHLQLSQSVLDQQLALGDGIDLAGGLAGLKFKTDASVDASLGLDIVFGADIAELVSSGDPDKWFFVRNPSANASVDLTASDIEASARFGFLSIGVDEGTLTTPSPIALTVSLKDPKTQADDGRIDLGELKEGIADPATLLTTQFSGSVDLFLPVEAPFLGLPAVPPVDPDYAITVHIGDLGDLSSSTVTLGAKLTDLGNFGNIDAASLVGLLGQLTNWLDDFRHGDQFANFDIPLVGTALDSVLGFADAFRDKLLLDDGDDGIDAANSLVFDLNAALEDAHLADRLRAEAVVGGPDNGKIRLVANDAAIGSFSVTAAAGLGFGNQSSSGTLYQALTASATPPNLKLGADASFQVVIDGAPAVAVTLKSANTADNTKFGNDRWKLVNADNVATFATVDEMALKLAEVLGLQNLLVYNPSEQILSFTLSLSDVFGQTDLPVDFALDNLPEFLKLQTGGVIRLKADGNLNLTIGVYLGEAPASTKLDGTELLSELNGGIDISTDLHIDGTGDVRTVYGVLSGDAHFGLAIDGAAAVAVTVTKQASDDNATAADLAADINAALQAKGLDTQVVAVADGLRIALEKAPGASFTTLKLTASTSDAAVKDIGFAASQEGAAGPRKIVASGNLQSGDGKLAADAHFTLTVDGSDKTVTLTKSATQTNTTQAELITDLNAALAAAGLAGKVVATLDGQRIRLQEVIGGSLASLSLSAASNDPAVTVLGFATSQTGAPGPFRIAATKDLQALRGRLTADASFTLATDTVNGGSPFTLTLTAPDTASNRYAFDIVSDIEAQLDKVAGIKADLDLDGNGTTESVNRIQVSYSAGRLRFWTVDAATSFTLSAANAVAQSQLGLPAGTTHGNSIDFVITTRNGATHAITLDGATTLNDVISRIAQQTGNAVTAAIGARGTGLDLHDTTVPAQPTPGLFTVRAANNAIVAIKLGIVRDDAQEGEEADGIIEGSDIAGLRPLDRFFLQNVGANIGLHLSTPTLDANGNVLNPDGNGIEDDGLSGTASVGFVGIEVAGGGTLNATLALGLKDPDGDNSDADGNRISLAELIGALDDLDTLVDAPSLTGGGQILLDVDVNPTLPGLNLGPKPQIGIVVADLGDPFSGQAPDISFVYPDLNQLLAFQTPEFNFQNILAGLQALADFLGQFESFGFLNEPLPLVDVSVNDLIGLADRFADALDEARANPAATVQFLETKLEGAFGLPQGSPLLDLELVLDDNDTLSTADDFSVLKFDIDVSAGFSKTLGIDLALDLGLDLPVDFGGAADLTASGSLDLSFDFGIRVDDPTQVFIYDSTGLDGMLNIAGQNLSFRAAVGPLGLFVDGGSAQINGTLGGGKLFDIGLGNADWVNHRSLLGDIDLDTDFNAQVGGQVSVSLPVYFPTDSILAGTVQFLANLSLTNGEWNASATPSAVGPDGVTPIGLGELFAFDPSKFGLLDQLLLGVDGVDLFLEGLQDVLDGEVGGVSLPLIGDKLAGAVDDIGKFRDGFIVDFRKAVEDLANPAAAFQAAAGGAGLAAASAEPDPISKILGKLLGDAGLGLLVDQNADGHKDAGDIRYLSNLSTEIDPKKVFFDWDFELGDSYDAGAGIGFDIGIPGLGLETEGAVNLTVGWTLAFGFGLNTTDGFYLDVGDDLDEDFDGPNELTLDVDLTVPGGGITGKLGFLQLSAKDDVTDGDDLYTHLGASFAVDLFNSSNHADTKLGFNELGKLGLDVGIAAEAVVDLDMRLALSSDLVPSAPTNFPSVVADFTLQWGVGDRAAGQTISLADLDGSFLKNGLQSVLFEHVGLDLGSYFTDLIGPIASKVQEITEPVKPFLDFLTAPIPVISQLAGPTSLLDIAAMSGFVNPGIVKAIQVIDQVVDIANSLSVPAGENAVMYFDQYLPSLVIYQAPAQGFAAAAGGIDLSDPNLDLGALKTQLLAGLDFLPEELQEALGTVASSLQQSVGKMLPGGGASFGFKLPVIDDPSQIFGMLLGQPADLVSFSMDALELDASFSAFFSLLGPLGVSINADFAAQFGPFRFAYDTLGVTEFASTGFKSPLLLFDGFYVDDLDFAKLADPSGKLDVPELQFDIGLWAAAELNLAVARGGVGGGLFADIDFDLHDPDRDGRVRIKELVANVVNQARYFDPVTAPLAVFDITGKLTAELFAFVKVDLLLLQIDERWHITDPITLLDFESNFTRVPTLATELGDGVLQLNLGKFAEQRVEGDLSDGDETFIVKQGNDASHVKVWSTLVDFDGDGYEDSEAQTYEATKLILALAGDGKDKVDLSGVTADIDFDLEGGSGDDELSAGSGKGKAYILGGAGKDVLTGGGGADTIFGEAGDDVLDGKGGRDWLFGDGKVKDAILGDVITIAAKASDGVDHVLGGADEDLLFGAGGGDTLEGGGGDDVLIGEGGQVTVDAGRLVLTVADTSKGSKGYADTLNGDAGKDRVWGGLGDDTINGGLDADTLYGEGGVDTINGGDENPLEALPPGMDPNSADAKDPIKTNRGDRIFGGTEGDTIHGNAGNDEVHGDSGNDTIFGDADDDRLFGGTGADTMEGNAGNDELLGNSDPDKLYGGIGNDILEGGQGNDREYGGDGLDLLIGGYGSDILDGQAGSDSYRITARGGSITELTTAYDTGTSVNDTDILTLVGTPQADTVLLRAMADFYFPTLEKLIGNDADPTSQGIVDRIFHSGEPDKLGAVLQALEDAYGPHDIPAGLVEQLIDKFQAAVQQPVLNAIDTANAAAQQKLDATQLAALHLRVTEIFDSKTYRKLDEIRTAITKAYEAAQIQVPPTLRDAVTNAYQPDIEELKEPPLPPSTFHKEFEKLIKDAYQTEGLVGLLAIVDKYFDANHAADSKQTVIDRIGAAYENATPAALQTALTSAQATSGALKSAILGAYDPLIEIPGIDTDTGFVALINNGGQNVERFNYRKMEGLVVNTLDGNDYVVSDDVIAATTVNLGLGEDRMQVGQVFRSERVKNPFENGQEVFITNITAEDVYTTLEITRGWLSNGISRPMTVNGGDDNDQFTVFHNVAVLNLNGGDGDDVFTVRAFALKGSTDSERARTDMKGDGGADTILYVVNAPVGIDGGDGFDTVRIVGTEFADDFVVTDAGIFGAGLNVSYVNIEKVVADGAEGDDRFFVLSTGLEVVTEIDGGLGSDSFFVGGNPSRAPVPVISNDFRGHSGIILHNVESGDADWNKLPVDGLSANVGDNEEDFVIVSEHGGSTRVVEDASVGGEGWAYDGYGIRLTRRPGLGQVVTINVVLAGPAPEDEAKAYKDLEFYAPATSFGAAFSAPLGFDPNTGAAIGPTLSFDENNWDQVQYVRFRAAHDDASEGRRFVFVNHTLQNSSDPDYQSAQMRSVKVLMEDDDRAGLIVTPSGRDNTVLEDGFTDNFTVRLARKPTDAVTLKMATANDQITLSGAGLAFDAATKTWSFTFSPNDADPNAWNQERTITITGKSDTVVEGFHTDYIRFTLESVNDDGEPPLANPDPEPLNGDPLVWGIGGHADGFINVDGDFDRLGIQAIPEAKPTSYVLLQHRPLTDLPITIKVGSETLAANRFKVSGNTLTFLGEDGVTPEFRTGQVYAKYSYREPGYDHAFVKDSVVALYDEDTPMVIVRPPEDGAVDVIERGDSDPLRPDNTDTYTVQLSRAPQVNQPVEIHLDAIETRVTYGRTVNFKVQVAPTSDNSDGDNDPLTLTFTSANWNVARTVTVAAVEDTYRDGNDTQVFAPELQTVNKIRGPLIIEGAAGAGSLSLPKPLMLPHELNFLKPDGDTVLGFTPGTGGGAIETMTVSLGDLKKALARLELEDSNIGELQDLVGKTLELSRGPGTDVMLDPSRPEDLFNRFWLIDKIVVKVVGNPDDAINNETDDRVELTLRNPTMVDPAALGEGAVPTADTSWAVTSLSENFFADEREQVDYLFVYDDDSVADDKGALTSSDGAVQSFTENAGATPDAMVVETAALLAVAKVLPRLDPNAPPDLADLVGSRLEITVGPGLGRAWTIQAIGNGPGNSATFKTLTLVEAGGSGVPTDRSEFRIAGGDTHGRITGFGMGPNVLFAGRPQGGGITYGDLEVVQVSLGRGDDEVRVDYATNAEDHTTKRNGDFHMLTMLDTGLGNDRVTVNLQDGDDGAFSLNLNAGDDSLDGSASSLPIVAFGWDGADDITGGSGDDILFGDRGRVDYVKTVYTDTNNDGTPDRLIDQIVTRLGHTVEQNPVNPPVTGATATTLTDLNATFSTDFGGLVGLSVQAISPEGHVQFRTIVANDAHTITVDRPWDQIPVFNDPLPDPVPDNNYYYRVSAYPEDQTDGQFRGPRVVWTVDDEIGDDDTIHGGGGADLAFGGKGDDTMDGGAGADRLIGDSARVDYETLDVDASDGLDGPTRAKTLATTVRDTGGADVIGGAADDDIVIGGTGSDSLDGGSQDDLIFGDNVTLDLHPGSGDAITPRFRTPGGATLYDANGAPLIGARAATPYAAPAWADWTITLDQSLSAAQFGNDFIAGGAQRDTIFGQRGNDTIQGDGSIDETVSAGRNGAGLLVIDASSEAATDGDDYIEGNAGADLIFGNLGQDDLVGGSSTLFSLNQRSLRDDEADLIFGGAGTDVARNNPGDGLHGRDSDLILGDNGNVYRLVSGSAYLGYTYDDAYSAIPGEAAIVVRSAELLDYSPGNQNPAAVIDLGAGDELHGESGDDFVYGMTGNDVLFGEGQDDDLIGGWGHDWISGGTGSDGVLGDDGRILTSRNGSTEPLSGVTLAVTPQTVSTPGSVQIANINVAGELKKAVDLEPFGAALDPLYEAHYANDILYGGWGDDFMHGGWGDDAISGAEALDRSGYDYYARPVIQRAAFDGNVLDYNSATGEFAAYNEYTPMTRLPGFVLDFDASETFGATTSTNDGADRIFGDHGNDWIVGGTGRDNLYGGWGDDLLNADDDLSTGSTPNTGTGLNTAPDTNSSYEDRAYGGAGRDVLIGNTGGDRLIDWVGEFNSYIVPFAPFGQATVSRTLQPQLAEFLYALSKNDGADQTLGSVGDPRNGEPYAELGVVRQQDFAWQDQTGAPADPQAGNVPGGKRDVLRSADMNNGQMQGLAPDSGVWQVSGGALQVASTSPLSDAVAVYQVGDALPSYYEVLATVKVIKPTGGWGANSYVVFDYQSKTNFKFAGIDAFTNKLVMGQRTAAGWEVLKQASFSGSIKSDTWYSMMLSVNGLTATLAVNNTTYLSYAFQPTVVDGYSYGLNWGMVGFGSNKARGALDNIAVQVVPPIATVVYGNDFSAGAGAMFDTLSTGSWTVAGGRMSAVPPSSGDIAVNLIDLSGVTNLKTASLLELGSTFRTAGRAGFVFDWYGSTDFKFAAIDVASKQVLIGHRTAAGWFVDRAASNATLNATSDYTLGVSVRGSTVSLTLNGQTVAGFAYNAVGVDGRFGLFARTASASFDTVTVKTNDPAVPAAAISGSALLAAATPEAAAAPTLFDPAQLGGLVTVAREQWLASGLVGEDQLDLALRSVDFQIGDLGGPTLARTDGNIIWVDDNAAGWGWFIDSSPRLNEEFLRPVGRNALAATPGSQAYGGMDLLTVLGHEIGHVLGFAHTPTDRTAELMDETLAAGEREFLGSADIRYFDPNDGRFSGRGEHRGEEVGAADEDEFLFVPNLVAQASSRADWYDMKGFEPEDVTEHGRQPVKASLLNKVRKAPARIHWGSGHR